MFRRLTILVVVLGIMVLGLALPSAASVQAPCSMAYRYGSVELTCHSVTKIVYDGASFTDGQGRLVSTYSVTASNVGGYHDGDEIVCSIPAWGGLCFYF